MAQKGNNLRWGIIGAGDVCEVKSGPGLQKAAHSELVSAMRRNGAKAEDFARRHGVPQWSDNAEALINDPGIDAVYIATPPASHKDYTVAALEAGKSVYVEKPVALNAAECEAMIAAESTSAGKLCAAHYRRFLPSFMKVKELLESGTIGTPMLVRLDMLQPAASKLIAQTEENWRVDPAISGGGLFHDLAPHQLDLMLHWFGPVTKASGFGKNQGGHYAADDCVHGWAEFDSGVVLQGRWHFAVPESQARDQCEIIGTEGRITINFFGAQVLTFYTDNESQTFELANPPHIQQPMIEEVVRYFRGERDNPCSMKEAKQVMALIDTFSQPG
ncbi:Gfo/Idh/MocA family protein [Marinimicrobium agarilyticum]|uniref:Gfo/Idh/MocA family protein n=1 Tax=Marinimicrobium agarilyticum TaxID=306546 RepID=UPI0003FB5CE4|nr:Gfo/Idh/MocA family oxidoreductase [Marinimicrobium agarilyticum]